MELYLVQHGEAMRDDEDPQRPLTRRGRDEVRRVSAVTARIGLQVAEIRHSGKQRAAQTAEIFADALGIHDAVVTSSGLAPDDDVGPVAATLAAITEPVMLVGHLPFLSRLTSLLLVGDPERPLVRFRTGGVLCLIRSGGPSGANSSWSIAWMLTPEIAFSEIAQL